MWVLNCLCWSCCINKVLLNRLILLSSVGQIVTWELAIVLAPTPSRSWRFRSSPPTSVADLPSSSFTWVPSDPGQGLWRCRRVSLWTGSTFVSSSLKTRHTKSQIPLPGFQLPSSNLAVLKLATDDLMIYLLILKVCLYLHCLNLNLIFLPAGLQDQVPSASPGPASPAQTPLHHQETKHLLLNAVFHFVREKIKIILLRKSRLISFIIYSV